MAKKNIEWSLVHVTVPCGIKFNLYLGGHIPIGKHKWGNLKLIKVLSDQEKKEVEVAECKIMSFWAKHLKEE
jgi:hypothetical protein